MWNQWKSVRRGGASYGPIILRRTNVRTVYFEGVCWCKRSRILPSRGLETNNRYGMKKRARRRRFSLVLAPARRVLTNAIHFSTFSREYILSSTEGFSFVLSVLFAFFGAHSGGFFNALNTHRICNSINIADTDQRGSSSSEPKNVKINCSARRN